MKTNRWLIMTSLGIFFLAGQAIVCELSAPSHSSTPNSPMPTPRSDQQPPSLAIDPNPLPRLSEPEIQALKAELTQGIATWFGLAGLAKMTAPPPLSTPLQTYRQAWSAMNVDVATFLGSWRSGDDYPYSLHIFPSKTPGHVCVLEFKPEWSLNIFNEATGTYSKDMISEQILSFSMATVQGGHLRSSQVRSVGAATTVAKFTGGEAYPVLLMGLVDDQGTTRVVALAAPPTLPSDLPPALVTPLSQTLSDYGCLTELTP